MTAKKPCRPCKTCGASVTPRRGPGAYCDFRCRFMSYVVVPSNPDKCCWLWTGARNNRGYGAICRDGRYVGAHRAAYELFVGPIPEGMQIDHRCHVRNCVNPEHLRLATGSENKRFSSGPASNNSSGFRGVYFASRKGKYVAEVKHNGKSYYAGLHDTAAEAARARDELARRLHGEFFSASYTEPDEDITEAA